MLKFQIMYGSVKNTLEMAFFRNIRDVVLYRETHREKPTERLVRKQKEGTLGGKLPFGFG